MNQSALDATQPPKVRVARAVEPALAGSPFSHRFRLSWSGWLGLGIVVSFALIAIAAPLIAPYDPAKLHPAYITQPPSAQFLFGNDNLGRDILSRVIYASRISLSTALLAGTSIILIGVTVGLLSGYFGGLFEAVAMRIVDVLLAVPSLVIALAVVGVLGTGLPSVVIGLVSVWWVSYARIIRGLVLSARERLYVESARALGASHAHLLLRHILPHVLPPVIVLATLELGQLILALAGLNFLGLGAQPPTPEWGAMLNEGRPYLLTAPHLMIFPGATIALVVLGFNLLGDGLRDALDPKMSNHLKDRT